MQRSDKAGMVLDLAEMTDHERYVGVMNLWGHSNPVMRSLAPDELHLQMHSWRRVEYVVVRWGDPRADDWLDLVNAHKPLADCQIYAIVGNNICQFHPIVRTNSYFNDGTHLSWNAEVAAAVFENLSLEQRVSRVFGDSPRYRWIFQGAISLGRHPARS